MIGDQKPKSLLLIPLITDGKLQGVLEFASINEKLPKIVIQFLLELGETIARTIYNLKINQKTEMLMEESRNMTLELRQNEQSLPQCFIFYKPRDVVSGDFPWYFKKNDDIYIAAVDCTGHGVPGALLSFIGFFLLNSIVDKEKEQSPAEICDTLHRNVRHTLKQDTVNPDTRDGMDIAFCKINLKKKELVFAGAHRPLILLSEGELIEFKGDRKSIGGISIGKKIEEDFVNNSISLKNLIKYSFFPMGLLIS